MTNTIPAGLGPLTTGLDELFFGGAGQVFREVDIFMGNGLPYYLDAPVIEGSISVDMNRDERRTLDLTLDSPNNEFRSDPTAFWYDSIIKVYRGVTDASGNFQAYPCGVFMIDTITETHFPHTVKITGRDYTKKMLLSALSGPTQFKTNTTIESIVNSLASNAGIANRNIPITGLRTTRDFMWEAGKSRWSAANELVTEYGYELFMDPYGTLIMRPFVDPTTAPLAFTFMTGGAGNIASYTLVTNDTRVYNEIIVKGGATGVAVIPYGYAANTEVTSPTRISRLGRRTYLYESKYLTTVTSCNALAFTLLKVLALESYELQVDSLVAPWLEAGLAVEFVDPDPAPFAPTRFLLTDFTIPLGLGTMSATGKRLTIVK